MPWCIHCWRRWILAFTGDSFFGVVGSRLGGVGVVTVRSPWSPSRRRSQLFPPLGCDGHHKMVDLRLTKRRAAEPGGSCAHLKGWMRERIR